MDDELLKKTKAKHNKAIITLVVLALFALAFFVGFRVMGPGAGKTGGNGSGAGTTAGSGAGTNSGSDVGAGSEADNSAGGTVTISIDCKNLVADMSKLEKPELVEYIPKDGVILAETQYDFDDGANVYDALEAVCLENDIQLETSEDAVYKSRYIEGISYLYEKDGGKMSGWLFSVNGEVPNYGASKVKLHDGDKIRWFYTVNYAEDSGM